MSAVPHKKKRPDSSRLQSGLVTVTGEEAKRAVKTVRKGSKGKKGAAGTKYRRRVNVMESLRSIRLGRGAIIALASAGALLAAAIVVAEPWVRAAADDYVAPTGYETIEPATIAVGQRWSFGIDLGENERISDIIVNDPDVLETADGEVVALGEYYKTAVTFSVKEKSLPGEEYARTVKIGALDFSAGYNAVRSALRSFLGIERRQPPRTELRTLRMCEQVITISGLESARSVEPTVQLSKGDEETIELVITSSEGYEVFSADESVVYVSEYGDVPGVFTIKAAGVGGADIKAATGFWKSVNEATYAEYLASSPALPAVAGRDPAEVAAAHPNKIFVRSSLVVFPVEVTD